MVQLKACLGFAVLLARAAIATLNTNCFRESNGIVVQNTGAVPCGVVTADSPNVACCNAGSYCLDDYICLAPGTPAGGFTGYYTGGCTDINYQAPECNPYCRNVPRADIVYNNVSQVWACCGTESDNSTVNCDAPTTFIFADPAPTNLSTTFSVGSTAVTSTAASTSSATITPATSPTTSSGISSQTGTGPAQSSSGLRTGAKAGIGVGCAIVGLAVLAGIIFVLHKRRKSDVLLPEYDSKAAPAELGAVREMKRAEMGTDVHLQELA